MNNISLSVDEAVLPAVRRYAVERDTSVNSLVRDFLGRIASGDDRARKARLRIKENLNDGRQYGAVRVCNPFQKTGSHS